MDRSLRVGLVVACLGPLGLQLLAQHPAKPDSAIAPDHWIVLSLARLNTLLTLSPTQARKVHEIDLHYQHAEQILEEGADRTPPEELEQKYRDLVSHGLGEVRSVLDSAQYVGYMRERTRKVRSRQPAPHTARP